MMGGFEEVVKKIDHCFYKNDLKICMADMNQHHSICEAEFEINDDEYLMLVDQFNGICDSGGNLGFKKGYVRNYLFIVKDRDMFVLLENAYPRTITAPGDGEDYEKRCELVFTSYHLGDLKSFEYNFIKPYLRKEKIQRLIDKKNNINKKMSIEEKIKKMLTVASFTETTKEQIEQSFIVVQNSPNFKEMYEKYFNWDEFEDMIIPFYQEHFSEEEIDGILSFYQSDLGLKILKFNEGGSSEMNTKLDTWIKTSYDVMMVAMEKTN